jgi:Abnormal spindle-like microcephaly-assoc'd, ASPM-SPD-2-Hydin
MLENAPSQASHPATCPSSTSPTTGDQDVVISSIVTNQTYYAQTNTCGTTVPPHNTCTFTFSFTPTKGIEQDGKTNIYDNASTSPQLFSLYGSGLYAMTLNPTSLSFPATKVGQSSTLPVSVTNSYTSSISITSIMTNNVYTQTNNCPGTFNPGASCTINVTFKPTKTQKQTGTLSIYNNSVSNPETVSLSGTGQLRSFAAR